MTDNHRYNAPKKGATDWHVPLNNNFEQLDTDVEVRDTETNLQNYTPKQGAKFLATDTENLYLADGTEWYKITSSGKSPTFESVQSENLTNRIQDAKLQAGWDGLVVPIANGLGMADAIDPSSSTPIQDAIDVVADAGGGEIHLPAGTLTEDGTISMRDDVSIIGKGTDTSYVVITATGVPGIEFNEQKNGGEWVKRVKLDDFALIGPGSTANTGPAIIHNGGETTSLTVGDLTVMDWHDAAYKVTEGNAPFQSTHNRLSIYNVDAGDTTNPGSMFSRGALIQWNCWGAGPANYFGTVEVYPTDAASGETSRAVFMRGGHVHINALNLGATSGEVAALGNNSFARIGWINWEPVDAPSNPSHLIRCAGNRGSKVIDFIINATGITDYIFEVSPDTYVGANAGRIGLGHIQNRSTVNKNVVEVSGEVSEPVLYDGNSSEIDVTASSTLTQPVSALGDLTPVS